VNRGKKLQKHRITEDTLVVLFVSIIANDVNIMASFKMVILTDVLPAVCNLYGYTLCLHNATVMGHGSIDALTTHKAQPIHVRSTMLYSNII